MNYFIIFICIVIFLFLKIFLIDKIRIDFKSFFKKGFKKKDNLFGLICYCGKQGKGKTYSAIENCIKKKLSNDYQIITNVKSFNIFSDTIYEPNILNIIEYCKTFNNNDKNVLIFFDEIFTILEKQTKMNSEILSFISQLRKRKIIFITTAQEWSEINITFRRYVRWQVDCNMFSLPFFNTAFIFNSINDGDQIKWDNDLQEFIAPRVSADFKKGNLAVVSSYDTYETISTSKDIVLNKRSNLPLGKLENAPNGVRSLPTFNK